MSAARKETIVIVHGTWAAPERGQTHWYQIPDPAVATDTFATKLNRALARRGSHARCWGHISDGDGIFSWSGENSWIDRTQAARKLSEYVDHLGNKGWICHIIAHSHGGNVVAEAIPALMRSDAEFKHIGRIVTLGTPFIDALTPINERSARRQLWVDRLTWAAYFILLAILCLYVVSAPLVGYADDGEVKLHAFFSVFLAIIALLPLKPWANRRRARKASGARLSTNPTALQRFLQNTRPLAISSPFDEAWQLLHHVSSAQNPFAVREGLLRHLRTTWRNHIAQAREVARIHGIKSFRDLSPFGKFGCGVASLYLSIFLLTPFLVMYGYGTQGEPAPRTLLEVLGLVTMLTAVVALFFLPMSVIFGPTFFSAMWTPLRWAGRILGAVGAVTAEIGGYFVRNKAWSMIQSKAMGLEGYRLTLPGVARVPIHAPDGLVAYEDLPKDVVARALSKRSDWIVRHLGLASDTLARASLSSADFEALQRTIAADVSLVHAAYYSESVSIGRIADVLAGVEAGKVRASDLAAPSKRDAAASPVLIEAAE
jgi:hypothetical protein